MTVDFAREAPPLARPVLSEQRWADLTFLHWAVDPVDVAPYLPAGTRPDVWEDGNTYVALVPFHMQRAGFWRVPAPYFGWFAETNIRLYSVDDEGRHGVVFRSLDASRLAIVLFARYGIGIPYLWSRMRITRDGGVHRYTARRRWPGPAAASEVAVRVGERVTPTPLEDFLTLRWGMHWSLAGRTWWIPNEHPAWPLHQATVTRLDDGFAGAAGFDLGREPDLRPLWTPGVVTRFGRPRRI